MTKSLEPTLSGARCVVIHCDSCPEHIETEELDYASAGAAARREGWVSVQISGEWHDLCPSCAEQT